ncbi:MAG: FlgD immunoglobulin-like domain containing protein, partial [Candidatus Latescibacterota bacterium]
LERVQVVARRSDSTKAQEVSQEEYAALPAVRQGAVEYYRRELSGRETLVSADEYQAIRPDRQGPIRYYRRETPRIAEIEVIAEGDNVAMGTVARGGTVTVETNTGVQDVGAVLADADYSTGYSASTFGYRTYNLFTDLGALFWVDTMHFLTDGDSAIDEMYVDVSDGSRAPDGTLRWTRVAESTSRSPLGHRMAGGVRYRKIGIEPARVRYIRAPFANPLWSLAYIGLTEIMVYGEGVIPEVVLTSDLMQFSTPRNLISIDWEAETPPGTRVQLQTRTGNELDEEKIYHDSDGNVVTEAKYTKLPKTKKGEVTILVKPGGDWSPWSVPYTQSGEEIKSPSPRQYMEVRAALLTDRTDAGAALRRIAVNTANPVADRLVGEVGPTRVEAVGRAQDFSYFIRPTFASASQGFDAIRIEATPGTQMELVEVRAGSDADFAAGRATVMRPEDLAVVPTAADTLSLRLPEAIGVGTDLVEILFRGTVLANSASFRALVQDSALPAHWQRVDEGDATDLADGQTVTVLAPQGTEVLAGLELDTPLVTPNADGIRDALVFTFAVARVGTQTPVTLTIYDLRGAVVSRASEVRADPRGRYALRWDGTDGGGRRVPPGIYLARIDMAVDSGSARATSVHRVVSVAY